MPERFRSYVAVYLVLKQEGKILLLRRHNTCYQDGNYSLVAGHLEDGETITQCIIREAGEEADIILAPEDLSVSCVLHRKRTDRETIDFFIETKKWSGEITNREPSKCDELAWYAMETLPPNVIPEIKFAIELIQKGIHYGEIGW